MFSFEFALNAMNRIGLDKEAVCFFSEMANTVRINSELSKVLCDIRGLVRETDNFKYEELSSLCDSFAFLGHFNEDSVTAFVFLACLDIMWEEYLKKGIGEQIFYDTADDLRCKLIECREIKGVNGCFVRSWLFGFFKINRFALGRMQFELVTWNGSPVILGENAVFTGDRFVNVHIPSSGRSFDKKAREDSYLRALNFYKNEFETGTLPIGCISWLLDPTFLKTMPNSNIADFARDFDVVMGFECPSFDNDWRVFGKSCGLPPAELPENSTLQRVCKSKLVNGEKFYGGKGLMFRKI